MTDDISLKAKIVLGLLHDYCSDAENESLPLLQRLQAAKSVMVVSPELMRMAVVRDQINGSLRERMHRVSVLVNTLETAPMRVHRSPTPLERA